MSFKRVEKFAFSYRVQPTIFVKNMKFRACVLFHRIVLDIPLTKFKRKGHWLWKRIGKKSRKIYIFRKEFTHDFWQKFDISLMGFFRKIGLDILGRVLELPWVNSWNLNTFDTWQVSSVAGCFAYFLGGFLKHDHTLIFLSIFGPFRSLEEISNHN